MYSSNTQKYIGVILVLLLVLTLNRLPVFAIMPLNTVMQSKLTFIMNDFQKNAEFGHTVAIDGDTMAVGDNLYPYAQPGSLKSIYIYSKASGSWVIQQKLFVGYFSRLALSGNTLIVAGVKTEVRVFIRIFGKWVEDQAINIPNTSISGRHFLRLAIKGSRLAVTSKPMESGSVGEVYIFERDNQWNWLLTITFNSPSGVSALALGGNTIVIADWGDPKVVIYKNILGNWIKKAEFEYPGFNTITADISGTTIAVGVRLNAYNADPQQNAIYVYEEDTTSHIWTKTKTLHPDTIDPSNYSTYGSSVAIDGNFIVATDSYTNIGYVYARSGTNWSQWRKAYPNIGKYFSGLNESLGISGDNIVIGTPSSDYGSIVNVGSVHVYSAKMLNPDYLLIMHPIEIYAQNIFTMELRSDLSQAMTKMNAVTQSPNNETTRTSLTYPISWAGSDMASDYCFHELSQPVNLLDTTSREGACYLPGEPLQGQRIFVQQATGRCGEINIPIDAIAIVGRVRVTNIDSQNIDNLLTFFATGTNIPENLPRSSTEPVLPSDLAVIGLNRDGQFSILPERSINLSIEVLGYFSR